MRAVAAAAIAGAILVVDVTAGAQAPVREERTELKLADGVTAAGTLAIPGRQRPPLVLIVGGLEATTKTLAEALSADGIASLRGQTSVHPAADLGQTPLEAAPNTAAWIVQLRNDPRWASITVAGYGPHAVTGTLAARAARADAFVSIDGFPATIAGLVLEMEMARLTIPAVSLPDEATTPAEITKFVRALKPPRHPESERRSPRTLLMTDAAGCRLAIEYGRLSKRGRAIWGSLVPFDKWWTPGADEAPVLTTSETIVFGDLVVPAGDYTLYTVPGAERFSLVINRETAVYHTTYLPERDLGRVPMTMTPSPAAIEQLTFGVMPTSEGGTVTLEWDDREYAAPFVVKRSNR
jgi:hypothetical protein